MRPLSHPPTHEITVEGVLHALADPVRAHIFAVVSASPEPLICSAFSTVDGRPVPKSTLSLHFKILREAGLIRSERHGVELRNVARNDDLRARLGGLVDLILFAYQRIDAVSAGKPSAP